MSVNRAEKLVYWYLRFNGYLTVENFTVHPDHKKDRETEADFLAVRFPYSNESPGQYKFKRDLNLVVNHAVDFIIGEAKSGTCQINLNSWGNPKLFHIQYALIWMGFTNDSSKIESIAREIHSQGAWSGDGYAVRFVAFGREENPQLAERYPKILQITHKDMLNFILKRLNTGCHALHRENWDCFIKAIVEMNQCGADFNFLLHWLLAKETGI